MREKLPRNAIFFCYRRDDSEVIVDRLYHDVGAILGKECLFRDIYSISPGIEFASYIQEVLKDCRVFFTFIGPIWASITDEAGNVRIHNKGDHVRIEIETALANTKTRIIPICVLKAKMPKADSLPESLRILPRLNFMTMRSSGSDYTHDLQSFVEAACNAIHEQSKRAEKETENDVRHEAVKKDSRNISQVSTRDAPHSRAVSKKFRWAIVFAVMAIWWVPLIFRTRLKESQEAPSVAPRMAMSAISKRLRAIAEEKRDIEILENATGLDRPSPEFSSPGRGKLGELGPAITELQAIVGLSESSHEELGSRIGAIRAKKYDLNALDYVIRELADENAQLRALYEYQNRSVFSLMLARSRRDSKTWLDECEIDRGAMDGVEETSPVITEHGLLGIVSAVSDRSAKVQLITNPGATVKAEVEKTREPGVVVSMFEAGIQTNAVMLLTESSDEFVGRGIVTAGVSKIFPAGIPIGVIGENLPNTESARVKLSADLAKFHFVLVMVGKKEMPKRPQGKGAKAPH